MDRCSAFDAKRELRMEVGLEMENVVGSAERIASTNLLSTQRISALLRDRFRLLIALAHIDAFDDARKTTIDAQRVASPHVAVATSGAQFEALAALANIAEIRITNKQEHVSHYNPKTLKTRLL